MKRTLCCLTGLFVCAHVLALPARAVTSEVLESCQALVAKSYEACVTLANADACAEVGGAYALKCDQQIVFPGGSSETTDRCTMDLRESCQWEPRAGYRIHRGACVSDRLRLTVGSDLCGLSSPERGEGSGEPPQSARRVPVCPKKVRKQYLDFLKNFPNRPTPRLSCRIPHRFFH